MKYLLTILCGLLLLIAVTWLQSCRKPKLDNVEIDNWTPEIASPLISSHFTARDIINKFETGGYIQTGNDNVITVFYTGKLFSINAGEILKLPGIPYLFPDTFINTSFPFTTGEKLTSVKMNSGTLTYDIEVTHSQNVIVELSIPSALKSGFPFKKTITLTRNGNVQTGKGSFPLDDYNFNLTGKSGTQFNVIEMNYHAYSATTGKSVPLQKFGGKYADMKYNLVSGFLGQQEITIPNDTIVVDIFKHYKAGTVYVDNPSIELTFQNSFGIPVTMGVTHLIGSNVNGTYSMTGSIFTENFTIKAPDISQKLQVSETKKVINNQNSNIRNFLAFSPGRIDYGIDMAINVDQPPNALNYLRDSSKIEGFLNLEIPFQGRIDHVVLEDTFDIDFDDVQEAKSVEFKLIIDNSFPLDAEVQLYFVDSSNITIDSLLPQKERVFESGLLDGRGIVILSKEKTTFFVMEEERFEHVKKAKKLALNIELITSNSGTTTVKFLDSNFLDLKMGVKAKLEIDL